MSPVDSLNSGTKTLEEVYIPWQSFDVPYLLNLWGDLSPPWHSPPFSSPKILSPFFNALLAQYAKSLLPFLFPLRLRCVWEPSSGRSAGSFLSFFQQPTLLNTLGKKVFLLINWFDSFVCFHVAGVVFKIIWFPTLWDVAKKIYIIRFSHTG